MSATFREAREEDAEALSGVLLELGYERDPQYIRDKVRELAVLDGNCILVAELDGKVIACAHVYETNTLLSGRRAEVGGFVVSSDFRGQGIGKYLMLEAEQWALKRGLSQLRLGAGIERTEAHKFYEKIGFGFVKGHRIYMKELHRE